MKRDIILKCINRELERQNLDAALVLLRMYTKLWGIIPHAIINNGMRHL